MEQRKCFHHTFNDEFGRMKVALSASPVNHGSKLVVASFVIVAFAAMLLGTGMTSRAATNQVQELSVAAAASLRFAMAHLVDRFEHRNADVRVKVTYGSSGHFFAMLSQRAPFDIFFSADIDYPGRLVVKEYAIQGAPFLYAIGRAVIWVRADSPVSVESLGIHSLLVPSIRKIAIANPRHAPYGRAARSALKSLGVYKEVQSKLVYGENVAQATHFVKTGSADIGMIALSLALAPPLAKKGRYWELPSDTYPPIEHSGVILHWAKNPDPAERFRRFVLGTEGRTVFKKYGYMLPGE